MKIGRYEVQIVELDGHWRYRVTDLKTGEIATQGYRPNENGARNAGYEDATLVASHCRRT